METGGSTRLPLVQVASQSPGEAGQGEGTAATHDLRASATRTLAPEEFTLGCVERACLSTSQAVLRARSRAKPGGSRCLSACPGFHSKPRGQWSRRIRASSQPRWAAGMGGGKKYHSSEGALQVVVTADFVGVKIKPARQRTRMPTVSIGNLGFHSGNSTTGTQAEVRRVGTHRAFGLGAGA